MKRILVLFVFIFLLSACGGPSSTPGTRVICNELSFSLDPALGNGGECITVPESSSSDQPPGYGFIFPAHTEYTIQNYP
jgi:hypothetical protein